MKSFNRKSLCALFMALLLVLSMCFTACGEKDPVKYEQKLEKEAVEEFAAELADVYDEYISMVSVEDEVSLKTEIDIEISDTALTLIELAASAAGADIDLSFLSNISIDGESYVKDNTFATFALMIGLGDSELIGLDMITDANAGELLVGIPGILTKYISVNMGELMDASEIEGATLTAPDFSKLPEGKELEKLINKYAEIIIDGIKNVERTEGSATANGVETTCEVLKITVTEADAMAIVKSLLTEARGDKDLEAVITSVVDCIVDYAANLGEVIPSGAEVYAELCDGIDELLADLEEETIEETEEGADALIITNYVDKDDEIIGRTISLGEEELFSYIYAENKGDFGFTLSFEGQPVILGSGTAGKKMNGTFELIVEGETMLTATLKDFDVDKMEKDGYFNGTIDIGLGALAEEAGDETVSAVLGNYAIRIEMQQKDKYTASAAFGLVDAEGTYFVKLAVATSKGSGKGLERPADENIIELPIFDMDDAASETLLMELLTSIDVSVIKDRLNASPIPTEYVEVIEEYLSYIDLIKALQ